LLVIVSDYSVITLYLFFLDMEEIFFEEEETETRCICFEVYNYKLIVH